MKALKWIGIALAGVIGLMAIAVLTIYLVVGSQISKTVELEVDAIEVDDDEASITRGEYLASAVFACTECHGDDFEGKYVFDEPGMASLWGSNLTDGSGGVGEEMTSEDWDRAVRHGIGSDGRRLILMPSQGYRFIDDDDLADIIAFAQSRESADSDGSTTVGPLGRILFLLGALPGFSYENIDHDAEVPPAPTAGPTAEYGEYLAGSCRDCHGSKLEGGPIAGADPSAPEAANLGPDGTISAWELEDFIDTIRTGVNPSDQELDEFMPWKYFRGMTDEDLEAIWEYIRSF